MCKGGTEYVFLITAIQLHYMPFVSTVLLQIVIVCAWILVSHAKTKIQTQTFNIKYILVLIPVKMVWYFTRRNIKAYRAS